MATHVLPSYARAELSFERGEGCYLVSAAGDKYLDFSAGIAVNAFGHAHPHLVSALSEQANKVWHVSNVFRIPGQERLADRLCAATFADYVFFTNSGVEAMECAIKTARKYFAVSGQPERYRLITFEGAFHGRSLATIAAGGNKKYLDGFGPPVEGFDQVPFGDMDAVKKAITPETAGFLIEPIQGEGGIRVPPAGFLKKLRALADEHGLLLVFDEIQCGMGRTGKLFAHEWDGVTPDIMAIAKAIGGGFPLGACLSTAEAAKGMTAGTHGSTYGGNPLAMAVGNAVMDLLLEDGFIGHVNEMAVKLTQKLAGVADEAPHVIEEVRGKGLMIGLKCRVPSADLVNALYKEKMLAVGAGENTVRLLPPLIAGEKEIDEAVTRLSAACAAIPAAQPAAAKGA